MFRTIKNNDKRLKISKIKMTCDTEDKTIPPPLENFNSFMLVVGKPHSGKTNLLVNLIARKNKCYYKKFDKIIFWSPSLHTLNEPIKLPSEHIHETFKLDEINDELNNIDKLNKSFHTLFIFDDFINEFKKAQKEIKTMIMNRRQYNLTIIIITQVYNLFPLEIRKLASSLFLFKIDKKEIDNIYDETITGINKKEFINMCSFVFDKPFNFLFIKKDKGEYYKNFNKIIINE